MRKPIVAGNWKMNGGLGSINELVKDILLGLATKPVTNCEVLLFPAFVHLTTVIGLVEGMGIAVGSQDVDVRSNGAVTGAVSAQMVNDIGCELTLCGHSERRTLFGETDEMVAEKFEVGLASGLTPILCVGETLSEREAGNTLAVVSSQLDVVIDRVGVAGMSRGLLVYEPVWAIGTGESATPAQVEEVHAVLRDRLAEQDSHLAKTMRILYGGSVSAENSAELFANENVDGGLIGGAALEGKSFVDICHVADASVS